MSVTNIDPEIRPSFAPKVTMNMRPAITAAALLLIIGAPHLSSSENHAEQSCIVVPDSGKLPNPVIRVVMDSEQGKFAKEYFRNHGLDPYRSAPLHGVDVRLTDSGDRTYLVGGSGPMTGGDERWFWLVQEFEDGRAKILLYLGTSCVQIEQDMSGGYRDVWSRWQTTGKAIVREYQWDGQRYKLKRKYTSRNVW